MSSLFKPLILCILALSAYAVPQPKRAHDICGKVLAPKEIFVMSQTFPNNEACASDFDIYRRYISQGWNATLPQAQVALVTFEAPKGHYGCQLSYNMPAGASWSGSANTTSPMVNIYKVKLPRPKRRHDWPPSYSTLDKEQGTFGTILFSEGTHVVNSEPCNKADAYLFEIGGTIRADVEIGFANKIDPENVDLSTGFFLKYDY